VFLISDLCSMLENYLEHEQVAEVYRAYLFGAEAHEGQRRMSGEPYIYHPLAVARILAEMRMDDKSIIAAILHDVIEDTPTAKEQIAKEFGEEVAELVDGVSKLTQVKFESRAEAQAENFRKMMLAMVRDIRVILVKLADRLHNMRTLGAMPAEKRRRIARETLEIYAPIAHRLGINTLRLELEELGFQALYPTRYKILSDAVKRARGNRKEIVQRIETSLKERLEQEGLACEVIGREKHLYSLYQKMKVKNLPFSEVFDVYAFRIIVDKVDSCYRALGIIHNLYKPVPGRFKDYIAIPKANGYQSLHSVLFGPYGVPIEMQIRTEDMNKVAEAGIAAHWLYKAGDSTGGSAHERARQWLRSLLEMQQNAGNSLEFLENVKIDLFPDVVYVFTPKGEIMELPRGATAVDFAYAVHTDVGNSCVATKIDRRLMPLRTELFNGQTVEIITAPGAKPNPLWLDFVITGKARTNIRNFLKNLQHEEAIDLGKRLLNKALSTFSMSLEQISPEDITIMLENLDVKSSDVLFEDIGLGKRAALLVAKQLALYYREEMQQQVAAGRHGAFRNVLTRYVPALFRSEKESNRPLLISGTEGMVVSFAKCCRPIPGDPILGFVTTGRGIVVHTESCKNVVEFRKRPDKWIDVRWEPNTKGQFPVDIRVEVINQRGVLATVAATIAEMGSNIDNVSIEERDGRYSTITFTIEVKNRQHLANIMRRVRSLEQVARMTRTKG
jgi:guanosine-3',5'-bis(diphosphate) 3'-pyrophosphohydrolase